MKKIFPSLLLSIAFAQTYAIGPMMNYYFANLWLTNTESFIDEESRHKFILGSFSPDVQLLGIPFNSDIPQKNFGLRDIHSNTQPFVSGVLFHNFIEEKHAQCLENWRVYSYIEDITEGHPDIFIRLLEDEIIYDKIVNPSGLPYFKKVVQEEVLTLGTLENAQLWHYYLSTYFGMRPSILLKYLAIAEKEFLKVSPETIGRWSTIIPTMSQSPQIRAIVEILINEITVSILPNE